MSLTKKIIYLSVGWILSIAALLTIMEFSLRAILDDGGWGKVENINVLNNFYETYELKIGGFYYNHLNKTYFEIDFINDDSIIIICDITNNNFILACELANKKNLVIFNKMNE